MTAKPDDDQVQSAVGRFGLLFGLAGFVLMLILIAYLTGLI